MKTKDFVLKKIPLEDFIVILTDAYDNGANYVDIVGQSDDLQDTIGIVIRESYFEQSSPENIPTKFSEEDISLLI
jgi:hypothetical protein